MGGIYNQLPWEHYCKETYSYSHLAYLGNVLYIITVRGRYFRMGLAEYTGNECMCKHTTGWEGCWRVCGFPFRKSEIASEAILGQNNAVFPHQCCTTYLLIYDATTENCKQIMVHVTPYYY